MAAPKGFNMVLIFGALLMFSLGYLIGVKRYFWLIAGYRPGRIKNEESVARSFRVYCFGGGVLLFVIWVSFAVLNTSL